MRVMTSSVQPVLLTALVLLAAGDVRAADPENCLMCHRYRGLGRVDDKSGSLHLYHVDPDYYDRSLGPHARLRCSDCHPREEVGVIPHKPVSPVNCTTVCHLSAPGQIEVQFSHDRTHGMLQQSVHTDDVLDRCNELLGKPLRAGQSRCLLCHDQPVFRRAEGSWLMHEAPVQRCQTCHGEQLPLSMDPQFMYWHVHARSRQSRSNEDLVRVCALCHSEQSIQKTFELHDASASYLRSFHGRAMLLGDEATAGCLDCHAPELHNVHLMLSQQNAESPTSPGKLPDTCRSAACHPTAGHRVSTAAVHLQIATSRGIEYFIALLFVVLILFTFGPSLVLQALEMFHMAIGRHDPRMDELHNLADRLKNDPRGRQALTRFTVHQRLQHWVLAITFILLVLTGFPIRFADRDWAKWLIALFGGVSLARVIHHWAGAVLVAGMGYHMVYVLITAVQKKRRTGASWLRTILDLPMITNPQDIRQLFQQIGYLLFLRKERPDLGRFSLKEKFEYFGVFWGSVLLGVTGILMWANAWTTTYMTGRVLTIAMVVHAFEAFLALLHVGIMHMIGVIFSPVVFPLSRAMFDGDTPSEELAEAHAGMVLDTAREIGIQPRGEASHG